MRNVLRRSISGGLLALLASLALSCSNGGTDPVIVPNPQDPGPPGGLQGIGIDFIPFEDIRDGFDIVDIDFESDGDVVVIGATGAARLYTPGGVFKRMLEGGAGASGLANNDSGRGTSYIGPNGNTAGVHDDAFVTGGDNTVSAPPAWFDGEPDPFLQGCTCSVGGQFQQSAAPFPHGFQYHRVTGRPFWKVDLRSAVLDNNPDADPNPCNLPIPRLTFATPVGGMLVFHPQAPFLDLAFNGPPVSDLPNGDWIFYTQKSFCDQIAQVPGFDPCWTSICRAVAFDRLYPTPFTTGESPRGPNMTGLSDFVQDDSNRLIMAFPAANSVCITEPVPDDGDHIVVQRILGGLQNGDGTGPLDLQGPRAVAINRANQDILVADFGHDRIVIFSSSGDYKDQFITGPRPDVIAVDPFQRIFVGTANGLEIYDQFGNTPMFGSIEGRVVDSRTNAPISNSLVRVNYPTSYGVPNPDPSDPQPNPFLSQQAVTNDAGYFLFSQIVLADQLWLTTTRAGYKDASVSVDVTPGQTTKVEIALVPRNTSSPGFGNVSGTILSADNGEPVANLNVGVKGTGISDRTNGNGEFLIVGAPVGSQTIEISANGSILKSIPNVVVADGQTKPLGAIRLDF